MSDVSASLHDEVVRRAGNRCEYCGLSQVGQEAAFHLDHVLPRTAGGPTIWLWRVFPALCENGHGRRLRILSPEGTCRCSTRERKLGKTISAGTGWKSSR